MKIAIFGVGAIGSIFGRLFTEAGHEVTYIARGKTLAVIERNGLTIKSIWGDSKEAVIVKSRDEVLSETFDYLFLAVKATGIDTAIAELRPLMKSTTALISVLNGIGNEEKLAVAFGADKIVGGSVLMSAVRIDNGIIHHIGKGDLAVGQWDEQTDDERLPALITSLAQTPLKARIVPNIREQKWNKLLWNIAFNPISALMRQKVGTILADEHLARIIQQMKTEFLAIAAAYNISIWPESHTGIEQPDEGSLQHLPSMAQDRLAQQEMELDAILGQLIQLGEDKHLPVATLSTIFHLLSYEQEHY
ncbi:ketopantoate reductase family protein [Brochothrix campestris]|uniref:2-dehydropantoate 2-reductase n=1 Tax=Brochothrix campestris FSL F6-1037 TaxID=1265861 RepID=W7CVE4_9LIST|nr:2-dehydropantoate 2-reductase [Brochothrix campestris]EUJ40675.1 2-dehydropantoate 2-reductase [Brochothrix campestris FSL F6-1037]